MSPLPVFFNAWIFRGWCRLRLQRLQGSSLRKHPFLLRSTPLGTFREEETKRPQRRRAKEKRMLSQAIKALACGL